MKHLTLNNGVSIPQLGLGTYRIGSSEESVYNAVRSAIDQGYRHIDTAAFYQNEAPIGKAIRDSGISRDNLFVTTKLWGDDIVNERIEQAFDKSMRLLDIDYLDLYLVHWPVKNKVAYAWQKLEQIYAAEKTRAIGVSNHLQHHLEEILSSGEVKPVVNQIEYHPYLTSEQLVSWCKSHDIICQSWSPLGSSKIPLLEEETLIEIGNKYQKSSAQIVLRWNIEQGIITIPKSSNAKRQAENYNIFDFQLTPDEVKEISALNKDYRTGIHPDEIGF